MERNDAITEVFPVAGATFSVTMPGRQCPVDGTTVYAAGVADVMFERAGRSVALLGPRTADGLKYMRGQLRLGLSELADLLYLPVDELMALETAATPMSVLVWAAVASMFLEARGETTPLRELLRPSSRRASDAPPPLDLRHVGGAT